MGRAQLQDHCNLSRARRTGFYHRVGALWSTRLRPFALPHPDKPCSYQDDQGRGYPSGCPGFYNACIVGRVVPHFSLQQRGPRFAPPRYDQVHQEVKDNPCGISTGQSEGPEPSWTGSSDPMREADGASACVYELCICHIEAVHAPPCANMLAPQRLLSNASMA